MRLRNGKNVESSIQVKSSIQATPPTMEADPVGNEDPYSSESTRAQCGSPPNSRNSPQSSSLPVAGTSGSSTSPEPQYPGQSPFYLGPVDPSANAAHPYVLEPYPRFADEGLYPLQNEDPYGTQLPPVQDDPPGDNAQPYDQTYHGESSSRTWLPQIQTTPQHNDSTNQSHPHPPPWSPVDKTDPSHHTIPEVPGHDNSPPYHPPYGDKLQGDLRRMEQEHGYTHEEQDDQEGGGQDDEKEVKRQIKKGKRKATSPPVQKQRHHKRDRDGGSGTGDGSGNRRSHGARAL